MEKKWICCTTEELGESWEVLADEKEKNNPNFLITTVALIFNFLL